MEMDLQWSLVTTRSQKGWALGYGDLINERPGWDVDEGRNEPNPPEREVKKLGLKDLICATYTNKVHLLFGSPFRENSKAKRA